MSKRFGLVKLPARSSSAASYLNNLWRHLILTSDRCQLLTGESRTCNMWTSISEAPVLLALPWTHTPSVNSGQRRPTWSTSSGWTVVDRTINSVRLTSSQNIVLVRRQITLKAVDQRIFQLFPGLTEKVMWRLLVRHSADYFTPYVLSLPN